MVEQSNSFLPGEEDLISRIQRDLGSRSLYTGGEMKRIFWRLGAILRAQRKGRASGLRRRPSQPEGVLPARVSLEFDGASEWAGRQTLRDSSPSGEAAWFYAPGARPAEVQPAWLESALLIAAAENLDALFFAEASDEDAPAGPERFEELFDEPWRRWTLFSRRVFAFEKGRIFRSKAGGGPAIAKIVPRGGLQGRHEAAGGEAPFRCGPYLFDRKLAPETIIRLADPLPLSWPETRDQALPGLLITAPFLARGGAEHTLYESMKILRKHYRLIFVTLVAHSAELDDRRPDFLNLSPRLYSLGDWLHPDAMPAILADLIDRHDISAWYNANGSTLFYDFGPRIAASFPKLRIVDHLYDHRVGYIEAFKDPATRGWIDTVVAENHLVAETLIEKYGWVPDRTPVVWPCGRDPENLPSEASREGIRRRYRADLGIGEETFLLLTAARMHPQKRPLDLVRLAVMAPPGCFFLVVGGGPLQQELDRAIAASGATNIRRLDFRSDIPELILAADAGLLVSEFEGLPVFALECLQLGRPFIGTDAGDLGTLLRESGAGICSGVPGDLKALNRAVRKMSQAEERVGFAARADRAVEDFAPTRCARQMLKIFTDTP